jgi:hypothetical protein
MRHLVYSVRYCVVLINSSLLSLVLHYSGITTQKVLSPFHDVITEFDCPSEKLSRINSFIFGTFFPENRAIYEIMWKNMVERDRPRVRI